ncbi:ORF3 [Ranid herpesvirus 1]|uniref:ORF3 n=1 Tax=Ranid herpesvirus 1 TaxID=85655 RepID=Q14VV5_9VIRU|nr:ORF3 [Ranid herpesvirus 1]ABG25808.1 ORF3 [Ranid herpesvirus 1]
MTGRLCFVSVMVSTVLCVYSETEYIKRGSNYSACTMKCPQDDVTLELYRVCDGNEKTLLENHCYYQHVKSHDPRLHLDQQSGCWTLGSVRKSDSCLYKVWCYCAPGYVMNSTTIEVLEGVHIYNLTLYGEQLGEEMRLEVLCSGELSTISWLENGGILSDRYHLVDHNRTLVIPGVQRQDVEKVFTVTLKNPVSVETREYRLLDNPHLHTLVERADTRAHRELYRSTVLCCATISVILLFMVLILIFMISKRKATGETCN